MAPPARGTLGVVHGFVLVGGRPGSGPVVEVRCHVPLAVAQDRYRRRSRDVRHLDAVRAESELWGGDVAPLGLGLVLDVDTSGPVDVRQVAGSCRILLGA